jgi:hypothetical protein
VCDLKRPAPCRTNATGPAVHRGPNMYCPVLVLWCVIGSPFQSLSGFRYRSCLDRAVITHEDREVRPEESAAVHLASAFEVVAIGPTSIQHVTDLWL